MMKPRYLNLILLTSVLVACDAPIDTADNANQTTATQTLKQLLTDDPAETIRQPGDPVPTISSASEPADSPYREIIWDDLMPADYRPEILLAKYMKQLEELQDDDPKAMEIYGQIQAELENAPINDTLNRQLVKLPGFIAPLENTDAKVQEFLLVPYYGACIHVPPPPINQTVLVLTAREHAIPVDNIYEPIWVKGEILTEGEKTDIGQAGYRIVNAQVETYSE